MMDRALQTDGICRWHLDDSVAQDYLASGETVVRRCQEYTRHEYSFSNSD